MVAKVPTGPVVDALVSDDPFEQFRRVVAALEASHAETERALVLLDAVVEGTPDRVFVRDAEDRLVLCNQAYAALFGRTPQDMIGLLPEEVLPAEMAARVRNENHAIRERDSVFRQEQPNGIVPTATSLTIKYPLRNAVGEIVGVVGIVRDVTDLAQARHDLRVQAQFLKAALDVVPFLVSLVGKDRRYLWNNRMYREWFRLPERELAGRHVRDVLGIEAYEVVEEHIGRALSGETVTFSAEIPYARAGTRRVLATYTPIFPNGGEVEGFVSVVKDVS